MIIVILLSYNKNTHVNKKPSVPEEPKKMVGKMKSSENTMKSYLGLAGKEDVLCKN